MVDPPAGRKACVPLLVAQVAGEIARSSWAGLTKMLATTTSHSSRARMMSASWPWWSAPMVGTSPMREPARIERAGFENHPVGDHRAATAATSCR